MTKSTHECPNCGGNMAPLAIKEDGDYETAKNAFMCQKCDALGMVRKGHMKTIGEANRVRKEKRRRADEDDEEEDEEEEVEDDEEVEIDFDTMTKKLRRIKREANELLEELSEVA